MEAVGRNDYGRGITKHSTHNIPLLERQWWMCDVPEVTLCWPPCAEANFLASLNSHKRVRANDLYSLAAMPDKTKEKKRRMPKQKKRAPQRKPARQNNQAPLRKRRQAKPLGARAMGLSNLFHPASTLPIPCLFADGAWTPLRSSIRATFSAPAGFLLPTRRVIAIANNAINSNLLLDFGDCTLGDGAAASLTSYSVPMFPTVASGMTSAKCGRNGVNITLTSPIAYSNGTVHIVTIPQREFLGTTAPTKDAVYTLTEGLIARRECEHLNAQYFAKPIWRWNKPRSMTDYSAFSTWTGANTAGAHLSGFCTTFSTGASNTQVFPMTVTYIIFDQVATGGTSVPMALALQAHLQLGTRWDSDHPMTHAATTHPTMPVEMVNASINATSTSRPHSVP